MTHEELLRPLFDQSEEVPPLDGWDLVPGYIDGQHAATAMLRGPEIHFGVAPSFRRRAVLRQRTREFLAPLLARHGYLTTRVLVTSRDKQAFVQRVGFKPTWSDGTFQYYLLGQLPFERS